RLSFERALDDIGARERAGMDFAVEALTQDFDRAVELLAQNELNPALPEAAFKVLQPQLAQVVAARRQSPGYLTQRSLRSALYPADDPSLREATPDTVHSLTLEDVRAFHRLAVRPDLTTLVVIGRVTVEQAQATVAKYFGAWSASGPKPPTDLP